MSAAALGLVLGAAIVHAGWNLLLHAEADRAAVMAVSGLVGGALLLPFAVADPPAEVLGLVLVSGVAEAAYALALSATYARGALSLVYPAGRGTAPLLATLAAWLALSESPGAAGVLGAALLGGGLVLLGLEARRSDTLPALGFALVVGLTIALYSVVDASAVRETSPLGYLSLGLLLQGALISAVLGFDLGRLRASVRRGATIGVGVVAAYGLVLFAFRLAAVGSVAALRETSSCSRENARAGGPGSAPGWSSRERFWRRSEPLAGSNSSAPTCRGRIAPKWSFQRGEFHVRSRMTEADAPPGRREQGERPDDSCSEGWSHHPRG